MRLPSSSRPGVSLLEAMIACTILFITVFALSQLMDQAGQQANLVRERSLGMQLAQSKLKELESGILPLTSGGGTFEEDPNWEWSLEAAQNGEITGLWNVTVQVRRQNSDTTAATLSQIILDPSVRGNSSDAAQIASSSSSSSTDPSSGQSGSTTPSTPASGGGAAPSGGGASKPSGGGAASGGGGKPSGGTGGAPSGGGARPSGGGAGGAPSGGGRAGMGGAGGR